MALRSTKNRFTDTRTINISGRDFLYVSNLLSLFRLLIVPILFWFIYKENYPLAVVVGGVAIISDLLDGFFARLLKQHSELGFILDPIADKFAIGAGIFALVLSQTKFPLLAFIIVVSRDIAIVLGNVYLAYKAKMITRSNWWGKCTSFSLSIACILFLMRSMDIHLPNKIEYFCLYVAIVFVVISFVSYSRHMINILKTESIQSKTVLDN